MKRPNTVQRGYKPEVVRFYWIIESTVGSYHGGTTWGGITNLLRRINKKIKILRVVDLRTGKVYKVKDFDLFMEEWAENYANPDWAISKSSSVEKF